MNDKKTEAIRNILNEPEPYDKTRGTQYNGYRPSRKTVQERAKKLIDEGKTKIEIKSDGSIDFSGDITTFSDIEDKYQDDE